MAAPIRFYFDFASPYAWFSLDEIERIAAAHGRKVEWRPVIVWALLKAQGIAPPMESPIRKAYMFADMARSARYYQIPYTQPEWLPVSTHLAARLFYTLAVNDAALAIAIARSVFEAYFVSGLDISNEPVIAELAARHGVPADAAQAGMRSEDAKSKLASAVEQATRDGACGSPFFVLDGEGFFGADRLPQLEWRLSSQENANAASGSTTVEPERQTARAEAEEQQVKGLL
jgi:2-hydroxychromene-2-carboxylate isomerase